MEQQFQPGRVAVPTTLVEIAIACRNLPDMDVLSKSDPMCVVYVKQFASEHWREIGRTEVIKNTLNPDFVRKFVMDYFFEEQQKLKFEIYDVDCDSPDLSKHDFLGSTQCSLGEIVSSVRLERPLQSPHHRGGMIILVSAEEVSACKDEITLQFAASKLDKKDFFGKSDPFLVFSRVNENRTFTVVHKTEVVKCNLNPTWRPFTLPVRTLCNGDIDRVIQVECYDWNQSGSHELIGNFMTTVKELSTGPGPHNEYPCMDPKKVAKKDKKIC